MFGLFKRKKKSENVCEINIQFEKDMSKELKKLGISFTKRENNNYLVYFDVDEVKFNKKAQETLISSLRLPDWEIKKIWERANLDAINKYFNQLSVEEKSMIFNYSFEKVKPEQIEFLANNGKIIYEVSRVAVKY
jgi:hypothetical protein